jgi:hypothetical protein
MNVEKCLVGPVVLVFSTALVAGCGGGGTKAAPSSGTSAVATSASAVAGAAEATTARYDISRVGSAKSSLPPGFDPMDLPPTTVTQDKLDAIGVGGLSVVPPATVTPPECASMLKPLAPAGVGAQAQGFVGSQGTQTIVVMAAQAATHVGELGHPGCDHIVVSAPAGASGTADRIPAPDIPGATTMGVQAHITAGGNTTEETTFTAVLGDHTVVVVQADLDPKVAGDLLSKVVAALKS